jgi:small subunit ribosomal protein S16
MVIFPVTIGLSIVIYGASVAEKGVGHHILLQDGARHARVRTMLKIRLQRTGRKHETTFRIVATDSKNSAKSGKILEILGAYDPRRDETTVINADRIKHWISVGAGLSGTVNNLLISKKIIEGKKVNVLPKKTAPKKEEAAAEAAAPAETPAI